MSKHILTADELRTQLAYDPLTGVFTRTLLNGKVKRSGTIDMKGYRLVFVGGASHKAHRLAWLYVYGEWPTMALDHINCVRDDNRIANLRQVTPLQNQFNRLPRRDSKSGLKGVAWAKDRGVWHATTKVDGHYKLIGAFATPEQAHQAYCDFVRPLHGEYFRAS